MKKNRSPFAAAAAAFVLGITALCGSAFADVGAWSGTGPFTTGPGELQISALAVSPYGDTVYGGTASGTVFTFSYPTLKVTKNGTGTGTVGSVPSGTDCGPGCSFFYILGTSVTLTANPDAGFTFTGWSGDCVGTSKTCTVTMGANNTVMASFTVPIMPGDINSDKRMDLMDAVLAMQVISGVTPAPSVYKEADVSGDKQIGSAELIFILQKVAEVRQ